mmetsp:Transcript_33081/g.48943  ORF Transcript_33081/g.48943 Transcript_33081/m.48943 type:complete len:244 (-) Transcript_33081:117-848(-)|eukprot:CAMPEP_0194049130 /NCGR_PEP_ID=MMETSP0009_2-20130614/29719_1 /TAXON_ID=210454 /ORGANISM="Grammatophora oceanica, Strain CCMP 410" /LENGTH=243 /DNA_ID=CAMNT_0038695207 /DNA_START=75 /DNA_END=806 /DNA_ORIENTATION=+
MKLAVIAATVGCAAAFAPSQQGRITTQINDAPAAMSDLKSLAEKSNPVLKYYDPLELASTTIWGESNEATIAFLRHSEIKHGRVAMAAFVGYIVQSNGAHFPWPISFDGSPFPSGAGSPPEQWDALPAAAKWQIILFIGFLEWFSEAAGTHYMRGGTPGAFPKFSDHSDLVPHPVPLNLFDPFGFSKNKSEEAKAAGLVKELNNGRLAQIGIIGFLSEQKLEGSVPLLKGIVSHYDGEPMAPF